MLNTNEHWINAIDFIGTFEISIFESWQNTHFKTTPNYIHKHVNHDLAIFCRVFSLQIAYLWKHKSCTQEDNLVASALRSQIFDQRSGGTKNGKWEEKENIHGAVEFLLAKFALVSIKWW
jgi:hypothetical protein